MPWQRVCTGSSALFVSSQGRESTGWHRPSGGEGGSSADLRCARNRKGCDIGYAPAIRSCEGAHSVDACTVAALDAITAFAVPNPSFSSQRQPVFSGPVALQVALMSRSLSLLRTGKFYFARSFQPSTTHKLNSCFAHVNAFFAAKTKFLCMDLWKTRLESFRLLGTRFLSKSACIHAWKCEICAAPPAPRDSHHCNRPR